MKKFPIGIATLQEIVESGYYYVDKTKFIAQMATSGKYYFLSRPRRFGKSLIVDALKQAFLGNKDLFNGLYLETNWDWSVTYPVIHISFASNQEYSEEYPLDDKINSILKLNAEMYEIPLRGKSYSDQFMFLINDLYNKLKTKVVILVDEYDKPILDVITNIEEAHAVRGKLSGLYGTIKANEDKIHFAFFTGVSKFAKAGIFSGLNNLNDITYDSNYATICGYTQEELETTFAEHLQSEDLPKIKEWYNGYNFMGDVGVYNPFSILNFLAKNKSYANYWFASGTPRFLIEMLLKRNYFLPDLTKTTIMPNDLDVSDIDQIGLNALMLQSGYLTIDKEYDFSFGNNVVKMIDLKVPNVEVNQSLNNYIVQYIYANSSNNPTTYSVLFNNGMLKNDLNLIESAVTGLLASIPHHWYSNNQIAHYEGFYCSLFYAFVTGIGYHIVAEDVTNKGRIDITVFGQTSILIFELKVNKGLRSDCDKPIGYESEALMQLKNRNYAQKYVQENKQIYLIGMEFNELERNLTSFQYEKI